MIQTRSSLLTVSSLFFAIGFLAIGYGMILTFVGVYLKEIEVSNSVLGLINAAFFLGAIASSVFSQKLISSVGHIRSFAAFASVMVVSFLLHSLFFDPFLWGFLRLISGFSFYGLLIILESWLNEKSAAEERGKMLAMYTIVFYLCTALGQLFLNIEDKFRQSIFTVGSILVLVSVMLIALTKVKEPILKPFEKYSVPKIFAVVPLAVTTSFIGGFLVGGFFTMIPVVVLEKFDSIEVVSYFMLITLLGGLLSQWPIGLLSDAYGRRKLIAMTALFTACVSVLFIYATPTVTLLYGCGFLLGLTIFALYPLGVARANDVVDENKDIVEISRTLLFSYGIGSFLSPLMIGFLLSYSNDAVFMLFALLGIYLTFYSLSKKRVADDDMSAFIGMPMFSSEELPELDPRQDEG